MVSVYPVLFTQTDSVVLVEVPDLGILTEGADFSNAIYMARDAISIKGLSMEDAKESIPRPSAIDDIDVSAGTFSADGHTIVTLVDVDFVEYRRKIDNRTVRRNVSLPSWLDYKVQESGINVSRVLQEALMEKLGLKNYSL